MNYFHTSQLYIGHSYGNKFHLKLIERGGLVKEYYFGHIKNKTLRISLKHTQRAPFSGFSMCNYAW